MRQVELCIKGKIKERWSEWFGGLTICQAGPDETVLTGRLPDEAALYGIISRLRDLGLELTSLHSEEIMENSHESTN